MRRQRLAILAILLASAATQGRAQTFRYVAFGDSITQGNSTFDPTGQGGYPGRLDNAGYLNCTVNDCVVVNEGKDGERTSQGVTRLQGILDDDPWDVMILMHGTNDIFHEISNNTIEANLTTMDTMATGYGVDTLHGSMIHLDPESDGGMDDDMVDNVQNMRTRVMSLAASRSRYFADPWTPLCTNQSCYDNHYHDPPGAVGHPDPSGFDILTDVFRDSIVSSPVPATSTAVAPTGTIDDSTPDVIWTREAAQNATWYAFRLRDGSSTIILDAWHEAGAICTGASCTVAIGPLADGAYTWEVRGRNPRGHSAWVSTPFTVFTLLPPTESLLLAPITYTGEAEPLFEWQREVPKVAATYRLEVSDPGGVILDTVYATGDACALNPSCSVDPFNGAPLVPEVLYSWRVQGENAAGTSPWTVRVEFEVLPGLMFFDGFESGDTSAWSSVIP